MLEIVREDGIDFPSKNSKIKRRMVIVKCNFCNDEWRIPHSQVKTSKTGRCRKCYQTKHNQCNRGSVTREYFTWQSMKKRCYDINDKHYMDYGGRGIVVCDKWKNDFQEFYNDMGKKPKGLTIERIDNNGNYEPTNCKWATQQEQIHNKRKRKGTQSIYRGVSYRTSGWRSRIGINGKTINIGSFKTEIEAARAFDRYILENNLPHKRNFE